jgi:beta-galactosidase GanA
MDKTRAAALRKYVAEGGTLIIDGRFGLVDDTSLVNADLPGGECNDLCGMDLLDADYEGLDFNYGDLRVRGYWGRELVRMTGGEAVGAFDDGYPAASRVQYGRGTVLTINTYLWYGYTKTHDPSIKQLAARLLDELSLSDLEVTGNAHVRVSENSEQYLFFIFNYTAEPQEVRATLRQGDKTYTAALTVAPGDSVIVAQDK